MLKKILFENKKFVFIISLLSILQNVMYVFSFFWIYLLLNDLFSLNSDYSHFFERAGISILFLTISLIIGAFWKFLIFDESLSHLDNKTRNKLENYFLSQKDLTFIHVTHHINNKDLYDQIITLNNKKLSK